MGIGEGAAEKSFVEGRVMTLPTRNDKDYLEITGTWTGISILALSAWSAILVLSGRYDQLFTYVIFASWILYGMTTAAVVVLRLKRPEMPRPYRTFGYPVIPVVFVMSALGLVISTFPYLVPPTLTIWQTAAVPASQIFLLLGTIAPLPIIFGYIVFVYWLFRGKVREGEGYH